MRTTLTIDDDVAARLERLRRERGISFKELINATLRSGLDRSAPASQSSYVLPRFNLGLRPGVDLVHALALDAELEDEEALAELSRRK
jgi:hypothetical protein